MKLNKNIIGADAEKALGKAGITANKNTVPFDPRSPFSPSGIRMGTPALTSRGMKEKEKWSAQSQNLLVVRTQRYSEAG